MIDGLFLLSLHNFTQTVDGLCKVYTAN